MKIFLDTASLKEIREGAAWGVVDGDHHQPEPPGQGERRPRGDPARDLPDSSTGPSRPRWWPPTSRACCARGATGPRVHKNIVVKVPCTVDGLKATKALSAEGHRVNVTLIFSATQALLAAKAGATFVSPVRGPPRRHRRPRAWSWWPTSCRSSPTTTSTARSWRPACATPSTWSRRPRSAPTWAPCPSPSSPALLKHPLTDIGLKRFLDDWEKAKKEMGAKARVG